MGCRRRVTASVRPRSATTGPHGASASFTNTRAYDPPPQSRTACRHALVDKAGGCWLAEVGAVSVNPPQSPEAPTKGELCLLWLATTARARSGRLHSGGAGRFQIRRDRTRLRRGARVRRRTARGDPPAEGLFGARRQPNQTLSSGGLSRLITREAGCPRRLQIRSPRALSSAEPWLIGRMQDASSARAKSDGGERVLDLFESFAGRSPRIDADGWRYDVTVGVSASTKGVGGGCAQAARESRHRVQRCWRQVRGPA